MTTLSNETLPPELELALAHTSVIHRDALRTFFELDMRFSRIVAGTNEPMLGQMRLAWWRETLAKPAEDRPKGDMVLDAIALYWAGREGELAQLVDGWENLLAEPPLGGDHALAFVSCRSDAMGAAFVNRSDEWSSSGARHAAIQWALADLTTNVSEPQERKMLLDLAHNQPAPGGLRAPFKGIAVLGALGVRSLKNSGRPLMEGRGASLTVLRAALFGR